MPWNEGDKILEADGRKSRQNDGRAMGYGIWNLPLAHARGSATLGFRLPEPRPLGSGWLSPPTQAPLGRRRRTDGRGSAESLREVMFGLSLAFQALFVALVGPWMRDSWEESTPDADAAGTAGPRYELCQAPI